MFPFKKFLFTLVIFILAAIGIYHLGKSFVAKLEIDKNTKKITQEIKSVGETIKDMGGDVLKDGKKALEQTVKEGKSAVEQTVEDGKNAVADLKNKK